MTRRSFTYPASRKDDTVDEYHGTRVADPYRWLEDPDSPETQAWVEAQNRLTFDFLEDIPARESLKARLTQLWDFPKYFAPIRRGNRYFYFENSGLQNQPVLYMTEGLQGQPRLVLDPNRLSDDGTVAVVNQEFSDDGKYIAYSTSASGSDWQEIRIRDVDKGRDYEDVLRWGRWPNMAWKPNGSGFWYNRYPEPDGIPPEEHLLLNQVYWHRLGTPQSEDILEYQNPGLKAVRFEPVLSDDGQYLVLQILQTLHTNRVYYRSVEGDGSFKALIDEPDASYIFVGNSGTQFYFQTNSQAARGRVIAVDINKPAREHWREIVSEGEGVLSTIFKVVKIIHHQLVMHTLTDAVSRLQIYTLDGEFVREVEFPVVGTILEFFGKPDDSEMFIQFESFLYPPTVFRYDFTNGQLTTFRQPRLNFDAGLYETKQVVYPSKDGTRVPMFLTYKKGLQQDGENPVQLFAYGGFGISLTPSFQVPIIVWLEQGGIFAQPCLRGGGEYGEDWHDAGKLEHKQNVFDDFIAAGEWLIANGYTRKEKLSIIGGSNGGLLVGACMVQRPDLFGAVICQVPVADMLRYHRFTVGSYWIPEYGCADDPEQFKFLYAYSPLHNVKAGESYPATLITTADHDDRVVPLHSEKFAATLQAADVGKNPVLIRLETKAGHGFGKPTAKMIEENADILAFLSQVLGSA
jgi:prolyl oligopeptidase